MPNGSLAETSCDQIPGDSVELETEVTGGKINKETVAEQGVLDPSSNVLSNATHRSSTHTHDESSKNGQDIESHVKSDESTNGITTSNTVPSVQETSESFAHSSRDKAPGLPSCGLLLPDYPTLYIVRSLESDEATLLGGTIDGTVGRLVQRNDDYNDFLHRSNVCEKDGKQDANSAEDGMTAKQSRRIESRQTHIEEDSRLSSEAGSAGFVASVIGSPPSNAFDTHYCANYERHQQNGEEIRDSAAQEDSLHQSQCRGDNENITFYAASKVKCLNLNPKDRHASYTPFATNGDTERWRDQPGRTLKSYPSLAYLAVVYVFSAIPLAVIGGMTRFHSGHSTHAQRAWTMSWMTFNLLYGAALEWVFDPNLLQGRNLLQGGREAKSYHLMLAVLVFAIPAIGGFVTVGQMLREYGSCTVIGGL
ncbi:MAG: hypothetical protein OHK93_001964 [Ramalina farinacea]|uniref:Uncharacterized protein n=1 Tax=Ramalina farinacea TaxID=258253 RepID=A0AA43QUX0_9LECA|nr:hypothetical protein [Ramalina farinacea]